MKPIIFNFVAEVKKIPKKAWVAAVILPGGFMVMATYLLTKILDKREEKNGKINIDDVRS